MNVWLVLSLMPIRIMQYNLTCNITITFIFLYFLLSWFFYFLNFLNSFYFSLFYVFICLIFILFFYFAPFKVQSCLRSFPQNQNYFFLNNNNFPVFQHSASANLVILCKNICWSDGIGAAAGFCAHLWCRESSDIHSRVHQRTDTKILLHR